jgi:hypothetical protein
LHFIPSLYGVKYELQEYYGKCGKFPLLYKGELEYEYAFKIRQQEKNCGDNATYFVKRTEYNLMNSIQID